ncbi:(2Fe-2S) ferredoxin domain-containing protein [Candidatus Woesearchaeota archaeon]|nr:(2Fe-2S) ferredoxin domain-containing protein [Candidatus Woesearchaeota archaeon]
MQTIDFLKPKLHLFICTNDRAGILNNTKPSCSPRITSEQVKELKQWIREQGLTSAVYCTATKCLGFCNSEGSVAVVYPQGRFVKGIQNIDDLKKLIQEELTSLIKNYSLEQSRKI